MANQSKNKGLLWLLVVLGTGLALMVVYWIGMFVFCSMNPIDCLEGAGREYLEKQGFELKLFQLGEGRRLAYYDSLADGETMVLVHGRIFSSTQFARHAFLEPLAGYRLVLLDLPGHGMTEWNRAGAAGLVLADLDNALSGFLEQWESKPVVLVGYALGGWTACRVASLHPGWIDRLVLLEPEGLVTPEEAGEPLLPATRKQWKEALSKAFPGNKGIKGMDNLVDDMMRKAGAAGLAGLYASAGKDDFILQGGFLPKVPTAVIYGEENLLNPPSRGRRLAKALDRAVFRSVAKSGAAPFLSKPRDTAEAILEALKELSAEQGSHGSNF